MFLLAVIFGHKGECSSLTSKASFDMPTTRTTAKNSTWRELRVAVQAARLPPVKKAASSKTVDSDA